MRQFLALTLLAGLAIPAAADDFVARRACLEKALPVTAKVEDGLLGPQLVVKLTNHLSWAIGHAHISYSVRSEKRSVSWEDGKFGMKISGGIEPGETGELGADLNQVPRDRHDFVVTVAVLDVADAENRNYVGETRFMDQPDELTPNKCP